jgi:hypothetical protein
MKNLAEEMSPGRGPAYQFPVDLVAAPGAAARLRHVLAVLLDPRADEVVAAAGAATATGSSCCCTIVHVLQSPRSLPGGLSYHPSLSPRPMHDHM